MKEISILALIISAFTIQSWAQNITNVKAILQANNIIVSYKIEGGIHDKVFTPALYYSTDGGNNYNKCKSTKAKYAKPNQSAQIIWNVTNDLDYFGGDNVVFKVKAYGFWNFVKGKATIRGKMYKTIKIGQQEWMAENLAYEVSNGCWAYENKNSNVTKYGYLYDWETAKIVAPNGWHLPTDTEWKQLERYLGMSKSVTEHKGWRGNIGNILKSTSGWNKSGNGNNSSGFSILPGGLRDFDYNFYLIGSDAFFWTATASDSWGVWARRLGYKDSRVERRRSTEGVGNSVRLVRD